MVMAQSLFISLKQAVPECHIDVLAPAWTLSLLARMPEVTKALVMPLPRGKLGLIERIYLGRQLRSERYDQAILLPNTWKSAIVPFFADIPVRSGYVGECRWGLLNDARKLNKKILTMTVQRFVALGLPKEAPPPVCPVPRMSVTEDRQRAVVDKFKITPSLKILALCPGAEYGPAKRWPASYFAEIARHKIDQGWQVWVFGSDKDKEASQAINQATDNACIDFTGRTTLAEAVDLMSLVDTVVSNDSGLMHVAAALDKKIIAIYGSSDPGFTPPLNQKANIISLNLDCAPCFRRECPLGHTRCLLDITPAQVLQALDAD